MCCAGGQFVLKPYNLYSTTRIWQFYAKYLISQSLVCMYEAQVPDKVLLEQAIQRYMASPGPSKCYVTSNTWDLGDEVPDMVVVYFSGENQAFRSP